VIFVRTLHPEIMGRRFIWDPNAGVTASSAFAAQVPEALAPLGAFSLKGIAAPQTAYGLT